MTFEDSSDRMEGVPAAATGGPVRLSWTDPETRDRIVVEVHGSEAFVRGLLERGFRLATPSDAAEPRPREPGRRARARSTRLPGARGRAGDAA